MILAIALGGAGGSVLRYLITVWMRDANGDTHVATLLINVSGCFVIGLLTRLLSVPESNPVMRAALVVGFCGGFTTFSTFSAEFVTMVQEGREARAIGYVLTSVVMGVLATVSGLLVGNRLLVPR